MVWVGWGGGSGVGGGGMGEGGLKLACQVKRLSHLAPAGQVELIGDTSAAPLL